MPIPLVPTLALAFVSFTSSSILIFRVFIPILPSFTLNHRGPVNETGLPRVPTLSPADEGNLLLVFCDLVGLALFIWQAVTQHLSGAEDYVAGSDPATAVRLWLALTLRQTCLFVVAALTFVHAYRSRPISFGNRHWMLWTPTLLLIVTSTTVAGVLADINLPLPSLFTGLIAYTSTISALSSVAFICLVGILFKFQRDLDALDETQDTWPPARETEEKPRPTFPEQDVAALKEGNSWVTSPASSRRESISAFSFSTHRSRESADMNAMDDNPAMISTLSIPPKSYCRLSPAHAYKSQKSPVSSLPATSVPHSSDAPMENSNQSRSELGPRRDSRSSWLTEPSSDQLDLTPWSFPTTSDEVPPASLSHDLLPSTVESHPITTAAPPPQVLRGRNSEFARAEQGLEAGTSVTFTRSNMSVCQAVAWLILIWVPWAFALPYLVTVSSRNPNTTTATSVLLVVSVTLSSPLFAFSIFSWPALSNPCPLDMHTQPSPVTRAPSLWTLPPRLSFRDKRSGSVTVVEGSHSGDVWIANGDAAESKGKLGRAISFLHPKPKLPIFAIEDENALAISSPDPIQSEESIRRVRDILQPVEPDKVPIPFSANPEATVFDFEDMGPQAESTPCPTQNRVSRH